MSRFDEFAINQSNRDEQKLTNVNLREKTVFSTMKTSFYFSQIFCELELQLTCTMCVCVCEWLICFSTKGQNCTVLVHSLKFFSTGIFFSFLKRYHTTLMHFSFHSTLQIRETAHQITVGHRRCKEIGSSARSI